MRTDNNMDNRNSNMNSKNEGWTLRMSDTNDNSTLSPKEFAEKFSVDKRTVQYWIVNKKIPPRFVHAESHGFRKRYSIDIAAVAALKALSGIVDSADTAEPMTIVEEIKQQQE
jgi:hypothetical protein